MQSCHEYVHIFSKPQNTVQIASTDLDLVHHLYPLMPISNIHQGVYCIHVHCKGVIQAWKLHVELHNDGQLQYNVPMFE